MMIGWITHKPKKVTTKNNAICFLTLPDLTAKVKLRLATKLKLKATPVEIILLGIRPSPSPVKTNNKAKSIAVLTSPTKINLSF